ncbi:unnamed protein product [Caenorhabditis angaria]|uniref:Uncharacterized protein n=1 Tax=Caenorhabditis angaria TaxID=860376 RepID=A0A9P1NCH9_9PELO|nr:unnamed protein product [Caenorhabditis angaria]
MVAESPNILFMKIWKLEYYSKRSKEKSNLDKTMNLPPTDKEISLYSFIFRARGLMTILHEDQERAIQSNIYVTASTTEITDQIIREITNCDLLREIYHVKKTLPEIMQIFGAIAIRSGVVNLHGSDFPGLFERVIELYSPITENIPTSYEMINKTLENIEAIIAFSQNQTDAGKLMVQIRKTVFKFYNDSFNERHIR